MVQLTERQMEIPYALAARITKPGSNYHDELVSLGNEALVKAAHSYDASRGIAPTTHLYNCVRFQLIEYSQRARPYYATDRDGTRRRVYRREHRWASLQSLDEPAGRRGLQTVADLIEDPRRPCSELEQNELIEAALRTLTPTERAVFILRHAHELPLKYIASRLGWSDHRIVTRHLEQAAAKVRRNVRRIGRRVFVPPPGTPPAHDDRIKELARQGFLRYVQARRALGRVPASRVLWYAVRHADRTLHGPHRRLRRLLRLAGAPDVQTAGRLGSSQRRAAESLATVGMCLVSGPEGRRLAEYDGYTLVTEVKK